MEKEMIRSFEEMQWFGRESLEAALASATALTRGMQSAVVEVADYSRRTFEQGADTVEKVLAAKSLDRAFEIQQGYARAAYEAYLGQVNKLGQIYLNAAKDAYKPFESRLASALPSGKPAK
jgi:hypothetical protein